MAKAFIMLLFGLMGCITATDEAPAKDYISKHNEALAFCKKKGFSTDYYFLVDMSIHSGKKRFFIYDFNQKKMIDSGIATHGSCDTCDDNDTKYEKAKFSNKDGSHCTSLGKYKIGKRDYSSWGINIKYWLEGLEESNNNATARVVVLHSWNAVPDAEIYPQYSPLSWGCPAVSDNFMKKLDEKLKDMQKPVLLWIVE
jgi:hypothetical protein